MTSAVQGLAVAFDVAKAKAAWIGLIGTVIALAVTGIKEMGDAHLTLAGQAPIIDVRAYITLKVTILPWIVRFNDLEL